MANKTTTSYTLNINLGFEDGDTRTVKIPNPIDDITEARITTLNTTLKNNEFFVGDQNGADFANILNVDRVTATDIEFDLS